jgi:prevent-host-death family protein
MPQKVARRSMQLGARRSEKKSSAAPVKRARRCVTATAAKNQFGLILENARRSGPVFIERHGQEQAVVLSIDAYNELLLKSESSQERQLRGLREEFDTLYARMQAPASRRAVDRLLSTGAEELNRAVRKSRG